MPFAATAFSLNVSPEVRLMPPLWERDLRSDSMVRITTSTGGGGTLEAGRAAPGGPGVFDATFWDSQDMRIVYVRMLEC